MPIFIFLSIVLSCFVASHMKSEDKTRYFIVLVIIWLIILLPKLISGGL